MYKITYSTLLDNTKQQDVDVLFEKVVRLDISRISARLQLGRKYLIESSRAAKLHRAMSGWTIRLFDDLERITARSQVEELFGLYQRVKKYRKPQQDEQICQAVAQMIKIAYGLDQSPQLSILINESIKLTQDDKIILRDWVTKLGHYYNACAALISAARRKRWRIFSNIQVESFRIEVPSQIRSPSAPGSADLLFKSLRKLPEISKAWERFNGSEIKAGASLLSRLDSERSGIKIHAEIKLLFYYELHPVRLKPRVICANKSACFLCDLFLRIHGQFQVPMTFGKLNERWILPDWLNIPPQNVSMLQSVIKQFDRALDMEIRQLLSGVKRMPDPMESAIGLPAQWSVSSSSQFHTRCGSVSMLQASAATRKPDARTIRERWISHGLKESLSHLPILRLIQTLISLLGRIVQTRIYR